MIFDLELFFWLVLFFGGCCGEIGVFVCYLIDEFLDGGVGE